MIRREPSVDFKTATDAGLEGLDDQQVLAVAAEEGRILVSHDRRTMPRHFADFIAERRSSGLVIISQKTATLLAIEELLMIWTASEG